MTTISRRHTLALLAAAPAASLVGCEARTNGARLGNAVSPEHAVRADAVLRVEPLSRPWQTRDPFLFCAYHLDAYPPGNPSMGPAASLGGRQIGRDFANVDGWNMYHGRRVPGFPRHPHRGFETVSVVKTGLLDHSDSLGATARYGEGDVQWLTAGRGILHAEMFPLVHSAADNPLEMFQIWLNLPAAMKMVDPHFSMLWAPTVPERTIADARGRSTRLTIVAGDYVAADSDGTDSDGTDNDGTDNDGTGPPAAPPSSYASQPDTHVAIWTLSMDAGAAFTIPAAPAGVERALYFYRGTGLRVGGRTIADSHMVTLRPGSDVALTAGSNTNELLMLQGRPIGEPVVRHGPFVMNTDAEIRQAYADYRQTQFGGWPWPSDDPVHVRERDRFARRANGELEQPG